MVYALPPPLGVEGELHSLPTGGGGAGPPEQGDLCHTRLTGPLSSPGGAPDSFGQVRFVLRGVVLLLFEGIYDLGCTFIIFDPRYPFPVYSFCFLQFQSPDRCSEPSGFLFLWKEMIFLPVETLVILPPHLKTFLLLRWCQR